MALKQRVQIENKLLIHSEYHSLTICLIKTPISDIAKSDFQNIMHWNLAYGVFSLYLIEKSQIKCCFLMVLTLLLLLLRLETTKSITCACGCSLIYLKFQTFYDEILLLCCCRTLTIIRMFNTNKWMIMERKKNQ